LLGQVLRSAPGILRRPAQAFDHTVAELLCELGVEPVSRDAALAYRSVGLYHGPEELIGRFVHPLLPLLIYDAQSPLHFL
jgi:hypothetical protein